MTQVTKEYVVTHEPVVGNVQLSESVELVLQNPLQEVIDVPVSL